MSNSRWPFIVLGIGFLIVGLLHLTAWLFMAFIYHGKATPEAVTNYLPVYGRLGRAGVWLFIVIVVLDLIAASMLLTSRRWRALVLLTGLLNAPIVPLGSIMAALA